MLKRICAPPVGELLQLGCRYNFKVAAGDLVAFETVLVIIDGGGVDEDMVFSFQVIRPKVAPLGARPVSEVLALEKAGGCLDCQTSQGNYMKSAGSRQHHEGFA